MLGTAASGRRDGSMSKYTYRVCSAREYNDRCGSAGESSVHESGSSIETSLRNSSLEEISIHSSAWSNVRDSSVSEIRQ